MCFGPTAGVESGREKVGRACLATRAQRPSPSAPADEGGTQGWSGDGTEGAAMAHPKLNESAATTLQSRLCERSEAIQGRRIEDWIASLRSQ